MMENPDNRAENFSGRNCQGGWLQDLRSKPVVIYGKGRAGIDLWSRLQQHHIPIECFADRKAAANECLGGIPVFTPDALAAHFSTALKQKMVVIIALAATDKTYTAIESRLYRDGFSQIKRYFPVRFEENFDVATSAQKKIRQVASWWQDAMSREIFQKYTQPYVSGRFNTYAQAADGAQYFPPDIPFSKGYRKFIDCGAYTGDTIKVLHEQIGKIKSIAAFEPAGNNVDELDRYLNETGSHIADELFVFPCGVYQKTVALHFNEAEMSSAILESGSQTIQCVSIDSVLRGFLPTFIKMDIEGAEYEALQGARQTIEACRPDLGICTYHYADDIWELPLLLDSWGLGYRFYLRSYTSEGFETVLYATTGEETKE